MSSVKSFNHGQVILYLFRQNSFLNVEAERSKTSIFV